MGLVAGAFKASIERTTEDRGKTQFKGYQDTVAALLENKMLKHLGIPQNNTCSPLAKGINDHSSKGDSAYQ
ncbi:unnamed protein product [Ceratitis capitata]|uniref:(Mediterranean fruit fly) hypothetical protein n=1 Tax=Ceratitis capitata TaxID=7213 RepID=A0A811V4B7_CERCA|nr:unnamed protein product [Ceratitis capitata]